MIGVRLANLNTSKKYKTLNNFPSSLLMDEIKIAKGLKRDDGVDLRKCLVEAKKFLQKKKYKKALYYLLELVQERKIEHADIYYLLGETYRILEDFDKAIFYLLKSISFDEFPSQAGKSLGICYFSTGNYKKCILVLSGCIKKNVIFFF